MPLINRDDRTNNAGPWWQALTGPLGLAVVITAVIQSCLVFHTSYVSPDGVVFTRFAQALAGNPLHALRSHDQHPGYPAVIGVVKQVADGLMGQTTGLGWLVAARAVSWCCGLASVFLVWQLARQCAADTAGYAALAFAVLPVARLNASDALSDSLHLALYLLSVIWLHRALAAPGPCLFFLAGVTGGAAYLVRPEGLSVCVVGGGLLTIAAACRLCSKGQNRKAPVSKPGVSQGLWAGLALLLLGALAIAAPYAAIKGNFSAKISAKFRRSAPEPLAMASPPNVSRPDVRPEHSKPTPLHVVRRRAVTGVTLLSRRLGEGFSFVLLIPLAVGFRPAVRSGNRLQVLLITSLAIWHLLLCLGLALVGGYLARRHLLPLLALSMPVVGMGVARLRKWRPKWTTLPPTRELPEASRVAWHTTLIGLAAWSLISGTRDIPRASPTAAQLIRRWAAPGDRVLTNSTELLAQLSFRIPSVHAELSPVTAPVDDVWLARFQFLVARRSSLDSCSEHPLPVTASQLRRHFTLLARVPVAVDPDDTDQELCVFQRHPVLAEPSPRTVAVPQSSPERAPQPVSQATVGQATKSQAPVRRAPLDVDRTIRR